MSNLEKSINELADLLLEVTPKIMQLLREEMRAGRGENLTVPQFRVLACINRGITHNKEIANFLGVSEAAMSRMIESLVKLNLVKKEPSAKDRRHLRLSLTIEGNKLFNQIKNEARTNIRKKMHKIDGESINQILIGFQLLQKNISILQDSEDK